jgi:hypothetical protein
MLVRVLEEKGVVITTNALSNYMTKLAPPTEEVRPRMVRKGRSVASLIVDGKHG